MMKSHTCLNKHRSKNRGVETKSGNDCYTRPPHSFAVLKKVSFMESSRKFFCLTMKNFFAIKYLSLSLLPEKIISFQVDFETAKTSEKKFLEQPKHLFMCHSL